MIFAFFSTKESPAIEALKSVLEGTFDILEASELKELEGKEFDYLVSDLDLEKKNEKLIKKVKEGNPALTLIYLSNALSSKELIKHQDGKFGGDIYLRTPVDLNSLLLILDLELSDTPSLLQELMQQAETPEIQEEEMIPDLPSEDIEMSDSKKDLDLELDELGLDNLDSSEELIEGTNELTLSADDDLDLSDDDSLEADFDLSAEEAPSLLEEDGLSLIEDDGLELSLGDEDINLGDDELSLGELELSDDVDDLDLSSNSELDLSAENDEGVDLSIGDDLDLNSDESMEVDFSAKLSDNDDELDLSTEDILDLSSDNVLDLSSEELDLGTDDLEMAEEEDLGFGLSEEVIEEENIEDLFTSSEDDSLSFEAPEKENPEKIELHMEEEEEDDGLDLFGELPSSPEIDALNLDDEDSSASLSQDALKKLQEIDEIMMDESNPKDVSEYLEAGSMAVTSPSSNEKAVVEQHAGELDRLGLTIRQMREDRNLLLEDLEKMKQALDEQKRENLSLRAELDEKKIENSLLRKRYEKQVEELKYQLDLSNERKGFLEQKNKEFESEFHKMNQKIRLDVKKIQTRERELESQIELMRADSEIQMKNRDQKILELKRKIDTLEFDLESVQVNEKRSTSSKHELEDKMERVVQTLRLAIGELENSEIDIRTIDKLKKNLDV